MEDTKTDCVCDRMVLVDESVFQLGIRCIKCGCNADHRVDEYYIDVTGAPAPRLTEQQRINLKLQVAKARRAIRESETQ